MSDDHFVDANKIGSGGFGIVYRYQNDIGETFARKVLRADADAAAQKRFTREVEMLSSLDHPNIIKIIGKKLDSSPLCFLMPLYKSSLRSQFPMIKGDEERIRKIFSAVLDAVAHAHSRSIIHRDLKPENVLMNNDNDVVVSDFGLGLILDAETSRMTHTGEKEFGTPFYTAPEQIEDFKSADNRSDIFSLGAILYELYTGRKVGPDMTSCPDTIRAVVEKCVAHNPDRRYQSVTSLQAAFDAAISHNIDSNAQVRFQQLIAQSTESGLDVGEQEEIGAILATRASEPQFIFRQFERMNLNLLTTILKTNIYQGQRLTRSYSDYVSSTLLNWADTDPVGTRCEEIYRAIDDSKSKADLLFALLRLGYNHNRFVVMQQAEILFLELTSPAIFGYLAELITEEMSVAEQLKKRLSSHPSFRPQHKLFLEGLLRIETQVTPDDLETD